MTANGRFDQEIRPCPAELETSRDPIQGRRSRWHVCRRFAERHYYLAIRLPGQWPTRDVDPRSLWLRRLLTGRSPRKACDMLDGCWATALRQRFRSNERRGVDRKLRPSAITPPGGFMGPPWPSRPKSVLDRNILPAFNKRLPSEIHGEDLRAQCMRVKARRRSSHRPSNSGPCEADIRLRESAWGEGGKPCRQCRCSFHCDFRAEGSCLVSEGNLSGVQAIGVCGYLSD